MKQSNADKVSQRVLPTQVTFTEEKVQPDGRKAKTVKTEYGEKPVKCETEKWFSGLFSSQKVEPNNPKDREWFKTEKMKVIKEKVQLKRAYLDGSITMEELKLTLRRMKRRKTPGPDGVPTECYRNLPGPALQVLLLILNHVMRSEKGLQEWKSSTIQTLHKGGPVDQLNNYRPIALLNVSYKIFTRILYQRMYCVMEGEGLLSDAQGGWRKGISTATKISTLIGVIQDSKDKNKPLHLVYIDIRKAYDTIEYWMLQRVLSEMGFSPKIKRLIQNLYKGVHSDVVTAYGKSGKINIKRGVRQGCPLSPLLFMLCMEPLLHWLKESRMGYKVDEELQINVQAWADDVVLIARSREEMQTLTDMFLKYCDEYGLTLNTDNKDKSAYTSNDKEAERHGLRIRSWLPLPPEGADPELLKKDRFPFLHPHESYKYLGVQMTLTLDWTYQEETCERKLKRQLAFLKQRRFDSTQCIHVFNTVILPA
ncbi:MAG TPA: reverse transcriptase family protein, partial [Candidatus Babeliaceae bacterium]|nr:reverse transcriptase family protein [Candidatus Babeliaceae bacterium]